MKTSNKSIQRPILVLTILIWSLVLGVLSTSVSAQAQNYMLLVIGPSSSSIDPVEQQVVERLRALRQQTQYRALSMATMHFDRPKEAAFASRVLGVYDRDLVCVCLTKMDPKTKQPTQKVYAVNNVTPESLAGLESTIQSLTSGQVPKISQTTSGKWPPQNTSNGNSNGNNSSKNPAAGSRGVWTPDPSRPALRSNQVFSWEGILNVCRQAENQSAAMWEATKNSPLRADKSDNPCRQSLLGTTEGARLLRIAAEEGHINPKDRLESLLRSRDLLRRQQPEYFLPPSVRPNIPALLDTLDQVEMIYWQLNP